MAAILVSKRILTSTFSHFTWQTLLQFLWPVTLFSLVPRTSYLVQRYVVWSYRLYQNLEQIDHDHVFDDVICKPSIQVSNQIQGLTKPVQSLICENEPPTSNREVGSAKNHNKNYIKMRCLLFCYLSLIVSSWR